MSAKHPEPVFFDHAGDFRRWLEAHHASSQEIVVGFFKAGTRSTRMTWSEAVDQALCFGWIDGVGRRIDDERHAIRFTPRKPGSIWSKVNVAKVAALEARGLMHPAGRAAFAQRRPDRTGVYSHENDPSTLDPHREARFRANAAAWEYFSRRAPSYQRAALHWVMTAKKEETRERRFEQLLENSANGLDVPPLRRR
ncbi:MAG: YdeI family protein [Thermomicrobiales bacterium]